MHNYVTNLCIVLYCNWGVDHPLGLSVFCLPSINNNNNNNAPYAYGTIIRTIRVWLYHMRIRVWYVPYAYGINTRMVQNTYIMSICVSVCCK